MENINEMHSQIAKKQEFQLMAAKEFGVSVYTVKNWFLVEKVPEKHVSRLTELLQNTLKQQIQNIQNALKQSAQ